MTSPLHYLEGQTITKIIELDDYIQLHFGNEIGISIYNEIEVRPSSSTLTEFSGKTIAAVIEGGTAIEFRFLDGSEINIDMHLQAYRGPEALELNRRGHPPVIWN
ncbi:MAG: hypothetical protein WB678_05650 [Stellaceae bacterium]